ncbi:MAG: gamma-glutamyl-gamma-aminobutyrate hydrolase family protein [Clostridia bacterium]|nr:gamma-glutamyl-gamma-aminobutyrate hydrolase family protein [Clostridia bacterium]
MKQDSRPLVGLVPLWDDEKQSIWMLPGYQEGIVAAGGTPVILPLTDSHEVLSLLLDHLDGVLVTGGQDVDPARYGEEKRDTCGELCPARDAMEAFILGEALRRDMPVFGICRGLQMLNVFLGGTLYQDIPTELHSTVQHHGQKPYDAPDHEVTLVEGEWLEKLLGKHRLPVNSYHHQGIREMAGDLCATAVAPDGLVEGVRSRHHRWVQAVQWHPEFMPVKDPDSSRIFQDFVCACRGDEGSRAQRAGS